MLALQRRAVARAAQFSTAAAASATQEAAANLPLRVELRETEGSRAARRLRKQGFLPGVLYGEGSDGVTDKVLVSLETRAFEKLHRKLWTSVENQVFDLTVGDSATPVKAYMRDLQLDPGTSFCWLCSVAAVRSAAKLLAHSNCKAMPMRSHSHSYAWCVYHQQ